MDRRTATIQDVAREAGVSTATVSRTLSKPLVVAKPTRQMVMRAVQKTGYRVNHTARNLRQQRSGSVIALVPNLANPFFSQILAGLSGVLTQARYGLLVADTQTGPDAEDRLTHYLTSGVADGLVLFDGSLSPDRLDLPRRPPIVAACEWLGLDLPSIRVDNAYGAELAVRHLAELGHRRIGYVTGPHGNVLSQTRQQGYERALCDLGLERRHVWMLEGDFTLDSGAIAARRWLNMASRPTALFCASDEMAVGFLGVVQRAGLTAPHDVSIVGFDNIEVSGHMTPALTTIRQPRTLIGERAAELLLRLIDEGALTGGTEIIDVELILRASTAPPPSPAGVAGLPPAGEAR